MNAHDRLERQLRERVQMRRAGHAQLRVRRPRPLTALSVAVTLAVVAVVVVALASGPSRQAATAPGRSEAPGIGPKPPDPGPASKHVNQSFLSSVENSVTGPDRACAVRELTGKPDDGTPSAEMLSVVPALASLPPLNYHGDNPTLSDEGLSGVLGVYKRYIRLARRVGGVDYYLVPVAHSGSPPTPVGAADRCYAHAVAALRAHIAELPPSQRMPTLRYGDAELALSRYDSETTSVHEAVLLFGFNRDGDGGGGGGLSPQQLARSGSLGFSGGGPDVREINGVLPGSVARVTLIFRGHGRPGNITTSVVNDVFVLHLPKGLGRLQSMVWLSASGQTIRTVDERSSGA